MARHTLVLLLMAGFVLAAQAVAVPLLLWVEDGTKESFDEVRALLKDSGAQIRHCYPPYFLAGDMEWRDVAKLPEGVRCLTSTDGLNALGAVPTTARRLAEAWQRMEVKKSKPRYSTIDLPAPPDDRVIDGQTLYRSLAQGARSSVSPGYYETNQYMAGSITVAIVTLESSPASPNSENWSAERLSEVYAEIMGAMDWWFTVAPDSDLQFFYKLDEMVEVDYEPIEEIAGYRVFWIPEALSTLGFPGGPGEAIETTFAYLNAARDEYDTDWSIVLYVVDSLNDADGAFADSSPKFAFTSFTGGIGQGVYVVMTYDNHNYGIDRMDLVAAHEIGHLFGATDQYSPCACDWSGGYMAVENQNCDNSCLLNELSIMKFPITAYPLYAVDHYAKGQTGLLDSDSDGIVDILDTIPVQQVITPIYQDGLDIEISGYSEVTTVSPGDTNFYRPNSINTISSVEYRIDSGPWQEATPSDGSFDGPEENFLVAFTLPELGQYTVEIRTVNRVGNTSNMDEVYIDLLADVPGAREALALRSYPNPFNPMTSVSFTVAQPQHVLVSVLEMSGRRVAVLLDEEVNAGEHTVQWDGRDAAGKAVSSGTYILRLETEEVVRTAKVCLIR